MPLAGRVAVVTGAARGIGFHSAATLAEAGVKVVLVDKGTAVERSDHGDPSHVERAAEEISNAGGIVRAHSADVTDLEAMNAVFDEAQASWDQVSILVNAAGVIRDRMVWNVEETEWDDVQSVHVKGAFSGIRALARQLRAGAEPPEDVSIVNFASSAGVFGNPGSSAYGSAKAGVIGLTRVTAMDLARYNVRANCIVPFAWTRMAEALPGGNSEADSRLQRLQALSPRSIGNLVTAMSNLQDPALTGQVIGLRGRELMVFSQPKIDIRVLLDEPSITHLQSALQDAVVPMADPLVSSLDIFNYDPVVEVPPAGEMNDESYISN